MSLVTISSDFQSKQMKAALLIFCFILPKSTTESMQQAMNEYSQ